MARSRKTIKKRVPQPDPIYGNRLVGRFINQIMFDGKKSIAQNLLYKTFKLLEEKGQNTTEVWKSIRDMDGSVQHLDFLSEEEKAVFKTYSELDQLDIIYQAANRQNHIDQGQSVNIIVHPDMPTKEINKIHVTAWKLGLKSLYYQHSMNAAQKFKQKKECASCEA